MRPSVAASPSILFVHGMWGHAGVWHNWRNRLEKAGRATEALTLPGHNPDDDDALLDHIRLSDYVAAVSERIAAHATPPVLIGHSLGGLVVQLAAATRQAAALVLVSASPPAPIWPQRPSATRSFVRNMAKWGSWRRAFRLSRREANYLLFNRLPVALQAQLFAEMRAESGRVVWQVGYGLLNLAGSNRLAKHRINCPILSLAGCQDRAVPVGVARAMARWYGPRLEHREYADHAHWMLEETGWEERVDEIHAWLQRRSLW